MGDRTTVILTVLNEHINTVKNICDEFDDEFTSGNDCHSLLFYEVNYGKLDFLEELKIRGIAYDNYWDAGSEYSAGSLTCRFTPEGEVIIKELFDNQKNPDINELVSLLSSHNALIKYILDHKEKISVLPWDNQAEYGRIYAALHLITPKP